MKIDIRCVPCITNQAIKIAEMTNAQNRDEMFRRFFAYFGEVDFSKTGPEISAEAFRIIKAHTGANDPYKAARAHYNRLFMQKTPEIEARINSAEDSFKQAVKFAVMGNIIDFSPLQKSSIDDLTAELFGSAEKVRFAVDNTQRLKECLTEAKMLLYIGDNCGEICLDKLLIKKIRELNPAVRVYFGVRGMPAGNDALSEDAYMVGMDEYAEIVSSGDDSMGTVLERSSAEFNAVLDAADVVIAKGQGNYEGLSETNKQNVFCLLMAKCDVIAEYIGVPAGSVVCMELSCGAS